MVLYIGKWNIRPEKARAYTDWTKSAMERIFSMPGIIEFRGYRPSTGPYEVAVTYEFADMNAWATWSSNEDMLKIRQEASLYLSDQHYELWGPSPVVPKPIRPGK